MTKIIEVWLTVEDFNALCAAVDLARKVHEIWLPLADAGYNNIKIGNVVYVCDPEQP